MGLISLSCPKCSGEIKLDDSMEFGFCMFCGTKVMIQEEVQRIRIEHVGKVSLDMSEQQSNFMSLADGAIKNGNYSEAYAYYTKVLECSANDWQAVFRKGLCAAYLSTADNHRFNELFNGIQSACELLKGNPVELQAKDVMLKDSVNFANWYYTSFCDGKWDEKLENVDIAQKYFSAVERMSALILYALGLIPCDKISGIEGLEDYYKMTIDGAIDISTKSQKNLTYLVGYESSKDKNGNMVSQPVYKKLSPVYAKEMKNYVQDFKTMYNNLPTTVAKIAEFDSDIAKEQAVIDDYNASLSQFFTANPENEKEYRHPGLFGRKKKLAEIEATFTPILLEKKALSEQSEQTLASLNKQRKSFISENTKKM